jgi:hypothetical protein
MRIWLVILALASTLPVWAGTIANGDFENGLTGWQAVQTGGAKASASAERPAGGKGALLLKCTGADRAWALGPALPGAPGDILQVTFSARHTDGQAKLLLSLVGDAAGLEGVPTWEAVLPLDDLWHKVALLIRTPPVAGGGTPHLAFGVAGAAGAWAIDDVDAQPGKPLTLPALTAADLAGSKVEAEVLPDDWKPEGNLDATAKELAGKTELMLNVNGIEIGLEPTFACRRGYREGMVVYAVNRGEASKELQMSLAAPVGVASPAWTVPIRPKGTTTFRMAVQSLRLGEFWGKLTAASANFTASAPVRLTCTPGYPDLGVVWRDAVDVDALPMLRQLGVNMQVLNAAPDLSALKPMCQAAAGGGEVMVAPRLGSLTLLQYPPVVSQLFDAVRPSMWLGPPDDGGLASLAVLPRIALELRKRQPEAGCASPPIVMTRDWLKGRLAPTAPAQITAEKMAGLVSVVVRPPALPGPCVLREEVDGKAEVVNGALCGLTRQTSLAYLRSFLEERRVSLPMLVGELRAAPGSDERLSALYLARAITEALAQGATGVLLDPHASATNGWGLLPAPAPTAETPVQQAVRLMAGELTGAAPIVALADTPGISADPEASVCYKPFLRGGEGIVVLWNNTSAPKNVTVEFRAEPVVHQRLLLSYQGDFAVQRWDPIMQFSEEAFKRGQPAIYVRLDPLQVQVHTFRLLQADWTWLRKVELTVPFKPVEPVKVPGREAQPWWRDMLGGRGQ